MYDRNFEMIGSHDGACPATHPEVPPGLAAWSSTGCPFHGGSCGSMKENLFRVDADDALIPSGGGCRPTTRWDFVFGALKVLVRESVERDVRFLGICLGGQVLAAAFGAAVAEKRWGERGSSEVLLNPAGCDDPLFNGIPPLFPVYQWHDDSFDLPAGAELLALSEQCPHQAFRVGKRGWGLQFHPEVTSEIIESWVSLGTSCGNASALIEGWTRREQEYRQVMKTILENFLK